MEGTCFRQMTLSPTIWTWTTVWHSIWCPEVKLATWLNQSAHILTEGHYIWMSHKLSCFALLYEQILPESPTRGLTVINTNGFANFRKFKSPVTLTLASGQGHISMHSTCSTTSTPNHLTVASRTTEIWPFECREISTFREVWTLVIAFLEGKLKIGLRKVVDQVPYYHYQSPVLSSTRKWRRRSIWKCAVMGNSRKSKCSMTLTLDGIKVTSTYIVCVGLTACPTTWL